MSEPRGYSRALLKISGEAFAGDRGYGLDPDKTRWIARQLADARKMGCQLGVVVGGGNIMRGVDAASIGVPPLVGDQMGMIATVLNALALRSALEAGGVPARTMSAFPVGRFVEPFEREKALNYLAQGEVVVFAGGTGNPCFTTDSAASLRAVETDAQVMVKATQVPGVFDKDPKKHPGAVMFDVISAKEVIERGLAVIDATSVEILSRKRIPIIVLDLHVEGNIARALSGEKVGTIIE
ncbi:MAG: UMP kinase [Desulfomonile tiedjei]|nr:UMP kinase [Desulfomonile tiedjei]